MLPSSNCEMFDPTTASNVVYAGYTDSVWITNDRITDIRFSSSNITAGFPINLSNIRYSTDGGATFTTSGLSSTTYSITANGLPGSGTNLLTAFNLAGPIADKFQLAFTIDANPSIAPVDGMSSIVAFVRNQKSVGPSFTPQTQTRESHPYIAPASTAVPGPLPIFGAAAAFSFSRKARKRISQAV